MSTLAYLKSLLTDKNVASVTPSSRYTVRKAVRQIDFSRDITVIEYGPGTGVFADYMLKRMTPDSRLIMIELNAEFISILNKIDDPRAVVHQGSAEQVERIALEHGLSQVDYILSGIPFSFLPPEVKNTILAASARLIRPGGYFLAYQTSTHLEEALRHHFGTVTTRLELRNIPPMCIYEAPRK